MVKSRRSTSCFGSVSKRHFRPDAGHPVRMIAAKSGHFHAIHQHHAELRAHQLSLRKNLSSCSGPRVGRDVVVLRFAPQDQIAHAAAHQPGLEAARAKSAAISMAVLRPI